MQAFQDCRKDDFEQSMSDSESFAAELAELSRKLIKKKKQLDVADKYGLCVLCTQILTSTLNDYNIEKQRAAPERRMIPLNYAWDVGMKHTLDLAEFTSNLEYVSSWHTDTKKRDSYLAPLLPIVQSSGTGKSRLIKEVVKQMKKQHKACRYILLSNDYMIEEKTKLQNEKGYDKVFWVPKDSNNKAAKSIREFVENECEKAVDEATKGQEPSDDLPQPVVLFFDEAQHLIQADGFMLRVLRWILREKPDVGVAISKKYQITAVLVGTTSSLANFFPEEETKSGESRRIKTENAYYEKGTKRFNPFITFRTMGCFAGDDAQSKSPSKNKKSEYKQSIQYSRPLFALLDRNEELEGALPEITNKVCLGDAAYDKNSKACLSVLGTRVQMGHTYASVVSDMVSKGY